MKKWTLERPTMDRGVITEIVEIDDHTIIGGALMLFGEQSEITWERPKLGSFAPYRWNSLLPVEAE